MRKQDQYGAPIGPDDPPGDGLTGIAQIGKYLGLRDERTIKKLKAEHGLPIICVAGAWISSKLLIDRWRRELILKTCQAVNTPHLPASAHHLPASDDLPKKQM